MAKYGGSSVNALLVDGYNLIPSVIEDLDGPALESVTKACTGLGDTWRKEAAVGIRHGTIGVQGYFDDDATGICAALIGNESTSRIVSVPFAGNTLGAKACCLAGGFAAKWARFSKIEDFTRARFTFTTSGQVDDDALILQPLATFTVDTNTEGANSQDAGASSAGGFAAYCHVTAYSGFTNVIVKVRHSPDDATYADLATFATFTAKGADRQTATGTVNRHLAVDINVTGAGSADIFVALRRL
jgi:hypothetical protein